MDLPKALSGAYIANFKVSAVLQATPAALLLFNLFRSLLSSHPARALLIPFSAGGWGSAPSAALLCPAVNGSPTYDIVGIAQELPVFARLARVNFTQFGMYM
jgi:hypothetical protein